MLRYVMLSSPVLRKRIPAAPQIQLFLSKFQIILKLEGFFQRHRVVLELRVLLLIHQVLKR